MTELTFGQKIRKLRLENCYAAEEVAEAIGVVRSTIWRLENDMSKPTPKVRRALAEFYKVSVKELL